MVGSSTILHMLSTMKQQVRVTNSICRWNRVRALEGQPRTQTTFLITSRKPPTNPGASITGLGIHARRTICSCKLRAALVMPFLRDLASQIPLNESHIRMDTSHCVSWMHGKELVGRAQEKRLWPSLFDRRWANRLWPTLIGRLWPKLVFQTFGLLFQKKKREQQDETTKHGRTNTRRVGPGRWGAQNFALSLSRHRFVLFFSLWVSSRGILVVFVKAGALKCARLEFSGCRVKPWRLVFARSDDRISGCSNK